MIYRRIFKRCAVDFPRQKPLVYVCLNIEDLSDEGYIGEDAAAAAESTLSIILLAFINRHSDKINYSYFISTRLILALQQHFQREIYGV